MATLTVTLSPQHDFTGDLTPFVHDIVFAAGADTKALFRSGQFNNIAIDADVEITGDAFANTLDIDMATLGDTNFTAAPFTFTSWSTNDLLAITGSGNSDTIVGDNLVANRIAGGIGADTMTGGADKDTFAYIVSTHLAAGETINGLGDTDRLLLLSSDSFDFSIATVSSVETLDFGIAQGTATFAGTQIGAGAIAEVIGAAAGQHLIVNGSAVNLSAVTFSSWDIFDTVVVNGTTGSDTLTGSSQRDTLNGDADADTLKGGAGNDTLNGGAGGDTLDGEAGNDSMKGGAGSDTYFVDSAGDVVDESVAGSDGTDEVRSVVDFSLGDAVHVKGVFENLTLIGAAASATGNEFANVVTGNAVANTLDGAAGADTMRGLGGNDTYVVDDAGDVVDELAGGSNGTDLVLASVNFSLADPTHVLGAVENLTLIGVAANATGNQLANTLTGNANDNVLNGLEGPDILRGLGGNDTYVVQNSGDVVDESQPGSGGIDLVLSSVNFSLANPTTALGEIENVTLTGNLFVGATGNDLANLITGNAVSNLLFGGGGDDTLDGSGGNDSMAGGAGNDTYIVDDAADAISEAFPGSNGTDVVRASVDFSLGNATFVLGAVENLVLLGTAADGTGNALTNRITGNANANTLDGGAGADVLLGGAGNDTYIVDDPGDVVDESAPDADGTDVVRASVDFSLGNATLALGAIENLVLLGTAANGTGNALANRIAGNANANILDGGAGADALLGGAGNDTYIVDNLGDVVDESAADADGTDLVLSAVSFTLSNSAAARVSISPAAAALGLVENLTLIGSAAEATGNGLANTIIGNAAANTIAGRGGNDTLTGGAGKDTFLFDTVLSRLTNVDHITDFKHKADKIKLDKTFFKKLDIGKLDDDAFVSGQKLKKAQDGDDRIIYDTKGGGLYFDKDGLGHTAAKLFAILDGSPDIVNFKDFLIVA